MPTVLAHAGHLLIDVPLFLGPVVLLGLALFVSTKRNGSSGER